MKYKLKVYSIWEYGQRKDDKGKPHQEDCVYPLPNQLTDSARTFILCDGMGGHEAGEVASATVCEAMSASIIGDGHDAEGIFTPQDFDNALKSAFDALDKKDNGSPKKMGTTMTLLKLHDKGAFVAHIGDSRVYHIRPGKDGKSTKILFQTRDHSLINDLISLGELDPKDARRSNKRNIITRAMQPNMDRRPEADIKEIRDIRPGDYFYLCSDGMLEQEDMENGESLRNIFSDKIGDDQAKVRILRSVTEQNRDNHTAFVVHITDVSDPLPLTDMQDEKNTIHDSSLRAVSESHREEMRNIEEREAKSGKQSMLLWLLLAAIVAIGVLVYIAFFKEESKEREDDKPLKELIEEVRPVGIDVDDDEEALEVRETQSYGTEPNSNRSTARRPSAAPAPAPKNSVKPSKEEPSVSKISSSKSNASSEDKGKSDGSVKQTEGSGQKAEKTKQDDGKIK